MLLKFEFENVRSFYHRTIVSMQAAPLQDKRDRLIDANGTKYLPFVAIYGPNASGKSNLVKAFDYFEDIIREGRIPTVENSDEQSVYDYVSFFHDYDAYIKPTSFEIEFITKTRQTVRYELKFESRIHYNEHVRKIVYEALSIDEKRIFSRTDGKLDIISENISRRIMKRSRKLDIRGFLTEMLEQNLNPSELFLCNGFRNSIDKETSNIVTDWFTDRTFIFKDRYSVHPESLFKENSKAVSIGGWKPFLEIFDSSIREFAYIKNENQKPVLVSTRKMHNSPEEEITLPSRLFESLGTIKFLELIIPFVAAIQLGMLIVFDELDSSLHPEIIAGLISVFNDPEINKKGAQLIITTHNPVFLNQKLLRRDQIWFVDKDPDTHKSGLYRLSDYGSKVVRNDTDIYMHYLMGDYGALPIFDMRAAFMEAIKTIDWGEDSDEAITTTEA